MSIALNQISDNRLEILLVDDDYNFYNLLSESIADNIDLDYSPDGFTAFKKLSKKSYDCIVCDVKMPLMDGVTLLEELHKKRYNIPVVLISGDMNAEISKEALRAGAYNVLEKPFPMNELEIKIQTAIDLHAEEDIAEVDEQEKAHIYNTLKSFYYDIEKVMGAVNKYQIPLSFVKTELEKKAAHGKCLLDDLSSLKYLNKFTK